MFAFLQHIFDGRNQFASGGLFLMILGSIGVFLRTLPEHLWLALVQQTSMMITVKDEDAAFTWVKEWFLEQDFLKRIRQVDLDTTLRGQELALIPAPGMHFFWFAHRPFWVFFYRSDDVKGKSQRRIESLAFRTLGRDQARLKQFVDAVVASHLDKTTTVSRLYLWEDYWVTVQSYSPRLLESVILKPGEKEHLVEDLERFRASRQRYRLLGIPYHRGYLLFGPPGTGKTSLVSALAARFGTSIYVVSLTDFNDRTLKHAMSEVQENSMILFEDIDCIRTSNRRSDAQQPSDGADKSDAFTNLGVTLSGLLNVLDGLHAPSDVVFVMTTNKVEILDPALLRPGRIDYKLFLGQAAESQQIELYRRFFPQATAHEASEFAQAHDRETMAEFQGSLLSLEQR